MTKSTGYSLHEIVNEISSIEKQICDLRIRIEKHHARDRGNKSLSDDLFVSGTSPNSYDELSSLSTLSPLWAKDNRSINMRDDSFSGSPRTSSYRGSSSSPSPQSPPLHSQNRGNVRFRAECFTSTPQPSRHYGSSPLPRPPFNDGFTHSTPSRRSYYRNGSSSPSIEESPYKKNEALVETLYVDYKIDKKAVKGISYKNIFDSHCHLYRTFKRNRQHMHGLSTWVDTRKPPLCQPLQHLRKQGSLKDSFNSKFEGCISVCCDPLIWTDTW